MGVAQLLASGGRFGTTYTVTRTAAGTYTLGRYTAGSTTSPSALASVQPVTGRDLQLVPEARRTETVIKLYADVEMVALDETYDGDQLTYDGDTYTVITSERWDGFGGDVYWKVFAVRKVVSV